MKKNCGFLRKKLKKYRFFLEYVAQASGGNYFYFVIIFPLL